MMTSLGNPLRMSGGNPGRHLLGVCQAAGEGKEMCREEEMTNEEMNEQTKGGFRDALFRLMESRPYSEISVTDIAREAGLGRATFYRHYQTKEDMIRDYLVRQGNLFRRVTRIPLDDEDDYFEIIFHILSALKEQKDRVRLIMEAGLEGLILEYMNDSMVEHFRSNHLGETTYAPYYFTGSLFNVSMQWIRNDCQDSVRHVADIYMNLLFLEKPQRGTERRKGGKDKCSES